MIEKKKKNPENAISGQLTSPYFFYGRYTDGIFVVVPNFFDRRV